MEYNYSLHIFPKAAKDMESIFNYIYNELSNPSAALKQIRDFEHSLETVCTAPFSCPLVANEYLKDGTLRKLIVNNYIIFYRANTDLKRIEAVRVLYGMMDFKSIL